MFHIWNDLIDLLLMIFLNRVIIMYYIYFLIRLYICHGYHYATGYTTFIQMNAKYLYQYRKQTIYKMKYIQNTTSYLIINEIIEIGASIYDMDIFRYIFHCSNLCNIIITNIIIKIMPMCILQNIIIWSILFYINLPATIHIARRYRKTKCVIDHNNDTDHLCNYFIF